MECIKKCLFVKGMVVTVTDVAMAVTEFTEEAVTVRAMEVLTFSELLVHSCISSSNS